MDINQSRTAIESHKEFTKADDAPAGYWRAYILHLLHNTYKGGATDAELMAATKKTRNVISGLRRALEIEGVVKVVGTKTDPDSGRQVNIYAINPVPKPLTNYSPTSKVTAIKAEIAEWENTKVESTAHDVCTMFNILNRIKKILTDG